VWFFFYCKTHDLSTNLLNTVRTVLTSCFLSLRWTFLPCPQSMHLNLRSSILSMYFEINIINNFIRFMHTSNTNMFNEYFQDSTQNYIINMYDGKFTAFKICVWYKSCIKHILWDQLYKLLMYNVYFENYSLNKYFEDIT